MTMTARVRATMKADYLQRCWEALDVEIARLQHRQKGLWLEVQDAESERDALERAEGQNHDGRGPASRSQHS